MREPIEVTAEVIENNETSIVAVAFEPATITADYEGIRAKIEQMIAPYDGVTAESLAEVDTKDCKAFRSDLNKISAALNDARKNIKKKYEAPLKAFETQVKELDELIKAPCAVIDEVIKSREAAEKEQKKLDLENHYVEFCEDNGFTALLDNVNFEVIMKREWLNKSFSLKKACDAIDDAVSEIMSNWHTLMNHQFFDRDGAVIEFFKTLSVAAALEYDATRKADHERMQLLNAQVEESQEYQQTNEPVPVEVYEPPMSEEVKTWLLWIDEGFTINRTSSQMMQIREACEAMGITLHGKVVRNG